MKCDLCNVHTVQCCLINVNVFPVKTSCSLLSFPWVGLISLCFPYTRMYVNLSRLGLARQNSHFQQRTMVRTFSLVGWFFYWHLLLFSYISCPGFVFRSCWNHYLVNTFPSWSWDLFCPLFAHTWTSRCKNFISVSYAYCREPVSMLLDVISS